MTKLNKSGFTLIELLIVIAIIGIISTLAVVALGNVRAKARDSKRVADLKQIGTALELYYSDNGNYPVVITPGNSLKSPDEALVYMATIPSNPTPRDDGECSGLDYVYRFNSSANSYNLSVCLGGASSIYNPGLFSVSPDGNFNCGQKVSDIDGNQYDTVQIGEQCWMKQNLNTGTMIASHTAEPCNLVSSGSYSCQNDDEQIEKYCYGYSIPGNSSQMSTGLANCATYGGLYEWQEMMNLPATCVSSDCSAQIQTPHQGICPKGWHIPTDAEFNTLEQYIVATVASSASQYACNTSVSSWRRCADDSGTDDGGAKGAGKSLKTVGQGSGVGAGDDLVSFSALLAGYRYIGSQFNTITSYAYFWSASQYNNNFAWYRSIRSTYSTINRTSNGKTYGFSVRCLKD